MANPQKIPAPEMAKQFGIGKLTRHLFICVGPDCVDPSEGEKTWEYLKKRMKELNIAGADGPCFRTKAACLRMCIDGPIAVVYPTDGTVVLIGYTAILKTAPQPNTARLFTEFLLSPEHSRIMADAHLQSVRPEVVSTIAGGGKLSEIKLAPPVGTAESEKLLADLVERWRDLFSH